VRTAEVRGKKEKVIFLPNGRILLYTDAK